MYAAGKAPSPLPACEHRMEVRLSQDAGDFLALVALNLDLAVLHRAAGATDALHDFGQLFLFRQTDADKVFHYRHRLATATGLDPKDVHSPTMLLRWFGWQRGNRLRYFRRRRQIVAGQCGKGSLR